MKIFAIECADGRCFISDEKKEGGVGAWNLFFDGKRAITSFCTDWYVIEGKPTRIQKEIKQPNVNYRYELIDELMVSGKIPPILDMDTVSYEAEYRRCWNPEFKHLESLYKLKSDPQPPLMEDVDIEFVVLLRVNDVPQPNEFAFDVPSWGWNNEKKVQIVASGISHQLLDKLIFPAPILHQRPCMLTSEQTYKIVRQYVKEHINLGVAEITSDYDFCFTVVKVIPLSEVEEYAVDVNLFTKKKSKLEKRFRSQRKVRIFEMTYSPNNYKGYTPITGFEGENQDDLKAKIDAYCADLIAFINTPVRDCEHCKGMGVIIEERSVSQR